MKGLDIHSESQSGFTDHAWGDPARVPAADDAGIWTTPTFGPAIARFFGALFRDSGDDILVTSAPTRTNESRHPDDVGGAGVVRSNQSSIRRR
jgi:hypothetical protein